MKIFTTLMFGLLALQALPARSAPTDICVSAFEQAEQEQAPISNHMAGRAVVGGGRLYFHTAPDKRCQLREVFVIPGDRLEAFADHGEFTSVIYWNPVSGAGTAGWVLSARLADTGTAIAAGPAPR